MDSIKKIINSGIKKNTPHRLEKSIRLSNVAALIVIIGMTPIMLLYAYFQLSYVFFTSLFLILFSCLIPLFNYFGRNKLSRVSFLIVGYGIAFANSTILGQEALIYLYSFASIPVLVLFFGSQERKLLLICLSWLTLLLVLDLVFYVKPFAQYVLSETSLFHIRTWVLIDCCLCLYSFVLFSQKESVDAERNHEQLIISTQALTKAKERAEEAAIVKSNFLATMSHEIRTPLNGVIGMSHLLLEDEPKPEHVESLNILKFAAENLLVLINDVLDFSKIDAGRITLESIPFSFAELIWSIENSSKYHATEKGIRFDVVMDKRLENMYQSDPVRLTQVLVNLTSNAIKFTKQGGVTLSVVVVENAENEYSDIEFSVTDTGIGIAEDKLKHIFDQFSQADSAITRHYGGSGLGLAITKGILGVFGTDICVESEIGKGSTFRFVLKMMRLSAERQGQLIHLAKAPLLSAEQGVSEGSDFAKLSVLVAEDNPVNIMVIRKLLTKWGIKLDIVNNGEQAVQMVQEKDYDLVLMDIQMPVMDGFQATLAIRSVMKNDSLPIVALTATTTEEFKAEAFSVGMNAYLGKPFNPNHLKAKIKQLCFHADVKYLI